MSHLLLCEQVSDTDTLTLHSINGKSLNITVSNGTHQTRLTVQFSHVGSKLTGLYSLSTSETQNLSFIFNAPLNQVHTRLTSLLQRALVFHELRPLASYGPRHLLLESIS